MAKVTIKHDGINDPDAKIPPKRTPVPAGQYAAIIASVKSGATKKHLAKITVEYQLLYGITEADPHSEIHKGRRVWQDYVLEPDDDYPDISQRRRFELRQLLDECDVTIDDDGSFDTDHLDQKPVVITVRHRPGSEKDPDTGEVPVFTNVVRVESSEQVAEDDLI